MDFWRRVLGRISDRPVIGDSTRLPIVPQTANRWEDLWPVQNRKHPAVDIKKTPPKMDRVKRDRSVSPEIPHDPLGK
jgi:hypothetical protein